MSNFCFPPQNSSENACFLILGPKQNSTTYTLDNSHIDPKHAADRNIEFSLLMADVMKCRGGCVFCSHLGERTFLLRSNSLFEHVGNGLSFRGILHMAGGGL